LKFREAPPIDVSGNPAKAAPMWSTFKRFLGSDDTPVNGADAPVLRPVAPPNEASQEPRSRESTSRDQALPANAGTPESAAAGPKLSARLIEFIDHLATPPPLVRPEELTSDDILFLEGLVRRLEAAQLEIAVLPEVTVRLTELLRQSDVPTARYVELLGKDNALSIEVLKTANSALYAHTARTNSLNEAVMRIGLTRLQGILMLSLMKARVLKAATLRGHAELLIDLALPLAAGATAVGKVLGSPADLCFMRAMLLHVEHLLILSTISDTSREHRAVITPSTGALMLAFERSGAEVRSSLAHGWALEEILLREDDDPDRVDYAGIRRAVVCRWLRRPLPELEGVAPELLERALAPIAPRVAEPVPVRGGPAPSAETPESHPATA
jgi:hypothetical protein